MTRFNALLVLLASFDIGLAENRYGLCRVQGCECKAADHPSWLLINCTLAPTQKLQISEGDMPDSTSELIVMSGESLTLTANSLTRLQDMRHIRISGCKHVVLQKGAAVNLNVVSAYLEIDGVQELKVEEKAFSNIHGPLTVTIRDCDYVSLEGDAFSWLLKITISAVRNLMLNPGVFTLEPTAANVGEHGPGMSIELKNLTVPKFPANTFGSSAAEIVMEGVTVDTIQASAFSANTYNVITATDCMFNTIDGEAFAQKSFINNLHFQNCTVHQLSTKAIQSAVAKLNITKCRFDVIETGAINATVAAVRIAESEFHTFMTHGFELTSWNKFYMGRNKFDEMVSYAIVAPTTLVHELYFEENEIERVASNSFQFVGQTFDSSARVVYKNNYFGVPCHCNISSWLAEAFGSKTGNYYENDSFCTVNEFFARCFNEPEQNMLFKRFLDKVCNDKFSIQCEMYKTKTEGKPTEIKNPRFPHKKYESALSDGDKKVIGIIVITAMGCVVLVLFITFIRWMQRRGYCTSIKNILISSNTSCGLICNRLCICGRNSGIDNTRSISELSVNEYSERRRLNEPRVQEIVLETTTVTNDFIEDNLVMDDKETQTLPEELTKELLENLKEKLEDPEKYVEAREMIEHLYELIKVEESCHTSNPNTNKIEENIYDLPFQNTTPRIGKNKKQMISVGTRTPSLDKLLPLSPYNRQTALAHEYFEPKDFAVHLYAEIANNDKERRNLLGTIPDIVEQVVPRAPYLQSIRDRNASLNSSPSGKSYTSSTKSPISSPTSSHFSSSIVSPSTIKSNKSLSSNSSVKMINRPLPEKPKSLDTGEGTSAGVT